jgi:hypothetical protein
MRREEGYSLTQIGVIMEKRVGSWCMVLSNGKGLQPFTVGERVEVWIMVLLNEWHYILCLLPYFYFKTYPNSASFILKIVTVMHNQVLEDLQHMAPLNYEN